MVAKKTKKKSEVVECDCPDTCSICEKWILHGEQMWTNPTRHLNEEACAAGLPSVEYPSEPVVGLERWPRLERVGALLEAHRYVFARTMPKVPHCYTVKRNWQDAAAFREVVCELHALGEARAWHRQQYDYLDVNQHYYWSVEDRDAPPEATTLINRAVRADYFEPEPPFFAVPDPGIAELLSLYGYESHLTGSSVLDVGALAYDGFKMATPYLAIGAAGDLARLPDSVDQIETRVRWFVPPATRRGPRRFDVVLCGAASQLTNDELERLPTLVAPLGRVVCLFSAEKRWRHGVGKWRPGLMAGEVFHHGAHVVVRWTRSA